MVDKLKYPIGTKIKFIWKAADTNKVGVIVGIRESGAPIIFLPTSEQRGYYLPDGTQYTWKCQWHEIEVLVKKNEQLEFSFMYEE